MIEMSSLPARAPCDAGSKMSRSKCRSRRRCTFPETKPYMYVIFSLQLLQLHVTQNKNVLTTFKKSEQLMLCKKIEENLTSAQLSFYSNIDSTPKSP
jgi:hypothetical protein